MSSSDDEISFLKVPNQSQNENVIIFSRKTLYMATNGFRTTMGGRGRRSYKGTLENGTAVFAKEISRGQYENFLPLVETISTIRHPNVVKFLGYCDYGSAKFIVYEFGGVHDLDVLLFTSHTKSVDLTWPPRASICLGIAHGLDYLHHQQLDHGRPVCHGNIKPFNILLDEDYNPKIVGFKIHSVYDADAPSHSRTVYGNVYRYDDITAFGILLLEVISGRALHDSRHDEMQYGLLPHMINDLEGCDDVLKIIDPRLTELPPEVEVKRFIDVALGCLQGRVNMSEVVDVLSGILDCRQTVRREAQLRIHGKEGPIHDVQWSYSGSEFAVVYGFMPAKATVFDKKCNPVLDLGSGPYNTIRWNPKGRFLCLAGFGNLPGDMAFWDCAEKKQLGTTKAEWSVTSEWSPNGCYFMTATTAPRRQVDNGIKIFYHNGSLHYKKMFDKLFQADWKPESTERFGDIAELVKSVGSLRIEETKPEGQGSKPSPNAAKVNPANPPQKAAYRPPRAKQAASVQAELFGGMAKQEISKNALRNKKKREKQREKKAAEGSAANDS